MHKKKTLLFICPSHEWGTRERGVLRDCKISLKNGFATHLYCYRDSFLDIKAKEFDVTTFYHHGKTNYNFLKWYKLFNLQREIKLRDISLIHCYIIDFLWPLSYFLRRNFHTPLIFSQYIEFNRTYRKLWHKLLIRRLDRMVLSSNEIEENVSLCLGIPKRKIVFCGLGINTHFEPFAEECMPHFLALKKQKKIGVWVSPHLKNCETLKPLINATLAQNILAEDKENIRVFLFCEKNWNQNFIFPELQALIKELRVEDSIVFAHMLPDMEDFSIFIEEGLTFSKSGPLEKIQRYMDVWLSIEDIDIFEDYSITALLNKVPILVPRNGVNSEMHRQYGMIGETYKSGDAREMREKWEYIFENSKSYSKFLGEIRESLLKEYGEETYEENLLEQYQKVWKKRQRFSRRRLEE